MKQKYNPNFKKKKKAEPEVTQPRTLSKTIQWFPGHMTAAKRQIAKDLSLVDLAIELCDARIPISSRNPQIKEILGGKPSLLLMNKSSLADPEICEKWRNYYKNRGQQVLFIDSITGKGLSDIVPAIYEMLKEKLERFENKGMKGRFPRVMIIGITNVGKSTLINKLCGSSRLKAEDRPGVTRENKWVTIGKTVDLLDTPGILWPKFEDENTGLKLAYTGAIRDEILDIEEIAVKLCGELYEKYPELLCERYKLEKDELCELMPCEIFEKVGRARGFLISGGEVDYLRTAKMLLCEFRAGTIGKISLELPKI